MSSYLRPIAQALADSLAAVTWDSVDAQPTVTRKNWAAASVDDMVDPVIFVTPGAATITRIGRGQTQTDYQTNIFVGRQVQSEADADAMLDLADELLLQVRAHQWDQEVSWPGAITSPQTVEIEVNPDDALNERNVWRAVITATYRVFEADTLPG